jgi:hypothetical protein
MSWEMLGAILPPLLLILHRKVSLAQYSAGLLDWSE